MKDILLGIVRRPFSVLMLGLGLVLAGFAGLTRIRVEYLPSIEIPIVDVITEFPELPPPQMEELVTIPVENALSSVAGVKGIRSLTRRGICAVSLTFGWEKTSGRDIEVRERIDSIFPSLPHGARKPIINSRRAMEDPFMILAVSPLPGTEERFAALVGSELKARLLGASSVASIRISGMEKREVVVEADSEALNAASLDILDLAEAVRSGIVDTQTGAVLSQGKKHPVRISSEILTPHDIEELPVIRADGRAGPRISSVGRAGIESGRAHSFFHADGSAAVGIFLYPSAAYGELRASRHMRAFVKELEAGFAGELSIRIIEDGAERIRAEMRGLLLSILISVCGSLAVLRLLSGSLTLAWITAASIPASLSLVCLLMAGLSRSVNIISILGLALGTGMAVDNSIIVLAHIGETESEEETAAGLAKALGPCAGSTLTSILVFFPIRFIPGMSGALFTDLALTIVILLAASFAAALTLTPALFRLKQAGARRIRKKPGFPARERPLGLALCAPLLSLALLPLLALVIPIRILPETRIRECGGFFIAEEGISAAEAGQLAAEIEKALLESGYARHTLFWGGFDEESPEDRVRERNGLEYLHFTLILSERMGQDEARKDFERIASSETGLPFTFDKRRDPFETLLGAGALREVLVSGAERRELGEERAETASLLDGLLNILPEPSPGSRGLSLAVDLEKAAKTGIDSERLIQTVKLETEGAVVTRMESSGGEWMDVRVRGRAVNSGEKLLERKVKNGLGGVSLKELVRPEPLSEFGELLRYERNPAEIILGSGPAQQAEIEAVLKGSRGSLASGDIIREGLSEILVIFSVSLLVMFIILAAQFESPGRALLCLASIPVAAAGALSVLLLLGMSLNLYSFLGILLLSGTVINTPIILSSSGRGETFSVAATTATTLTGVIPLTIIEAARGSPQAETAAAFLGGLLWGTAAVMIFFSARQRKEVRETHETQRAA